MAPAEVMLVDNGSLAPAATLRLRELANALAAQAGRPIAPVSLLHSSAIAVEELAGQPAEILLPALTRRLGEGKSEFVLVPLFFGPSAALTELVPRTVAQLRQKHDGLRVRLAPPLFAEADHRLARILADQVRAVAGTETGVRVALVDHGSPARAVTAVRDNLASQVAAELGANFVVAAASMERRPGKEYEFADPLLATLLRHPDWNHREVIVAMQFLLPGRHAGPDGDVAQICARAAKANPGLTTKMTPLVGEHPRLIEILADRLRAGEAAPPL